MRGIYLIINRPKTIMIKESIGFVDMIIGFVKKDTTFRKSDHIVDEACVVDEFPILHLTAMLGLSLYSYAGRLWALCL